MAEEKNKKQDSDPKAAVANENTEALDDLDEDKPLTEEEKAKRKSFRIFLLLAFVNIGFLSWLIYTLKYQVDDPQSPTASHYETAEPREVELTSDEDVDPNEEIDSAENPEPSPDPSATPSIEEPKFISEAIPLEAFLVNVVARHKGQARFGQKVLRIRIELIPEGPETAKAVDRKLPKVRDAINMLLSSQDYSDLSQAEGREALRRQIKEVINETIRPEKIVTLHFLEYVTN